MKPRASAESKRYASRPVAVAAAFATLPVEVQCLLRLCDGVRSLRSLRKESGLSQRTFDPVLARLVQMQLVHLVDARGPSGERARAITWATQPAVAAPELDPLAHAPTLRLAPLVLEPLIRIDETADDDFSQDEERFFGRTIDHLLEPEERVSA